MATNKNTNKAYLEALVEILNATTELPEAIKENMSTEEILNWLHTKIEQLDKKATTITAAQKAKIEADNVFLDAIVEVLNESPDGLNVTSIITSHTELSKLSNQKVTALLRKLVKEGTVISEKSKNKTIYKIATEEKPDTE
jgi:predicted transcriptional regulator